MNQLVRISTNSTTKTVLYHNAKREDVLKDILANWATEIITNIEFVSVDSVVESM